MGTKVKANWADPNTTAENEKLPGWLKWVWSGRGISFSLCFVLMGQITYYCTDLLGMPAATVGTLLLVSKIFDGITDIIAGYIIDKTNTRWGKARPYEIFVALTWLCTVLLFSTPNFGMTGKCIYVFCLYTIANSVCYTLMSCGDGVYLKRAIRSENNRVSLTAFQGALIMLFSVVVSILMPLMIATIGTERSGWTIIALGFAVPLSILGSIRMFTVKEVADAKNDAQNEAAVKVPFKDVVRAFAKNKLIFVLGIVILIYQMITTANPYTYYFKWIFGDISLGSLVGMASLATPFLLIFVPKLTRKIGTTKFLIYGMIVNLIGCVIRMLFAQNIVMLMVAAVLVLAGNLPVSSMLSIYVLECMDYGQRKSGVNIDGVTGSVSGFAMKLGSAFGSALMGLLMGASGYISDPAATTQPDTAINMIYFIFAVLPVIFAVVTLVLSLLYRSVKSKYA